jgi:tRNA dimethylallyltransferase
VTPIPNYPVIVGPTGGGKTALSLALAREYERRMGIRAEIVSADAFQIYVGMDIGTAKATPEERAQAHHHLIDIVDPRERFTVKDWLARADKVVGDLHARGVAAIVVGGTNLYVQTFLDGMFEAPEPDGSVVDEIRAMDQSARRAELERVDPEAFARIDGADVRRTVRALSVFRAGGVPISELQRQWDSVDHARPGARLVGLHWDAEAINPRINARVKQMVSDGLVDEVRGLWDSGALGDQARQGIGYKQVIEHLEGRCSFDDAIERVKIETRRFAKNQRTWLKRFRVRAGSVWIDMACEDDVEELARGVVDRLG